VGCIGARERETLGEVILGVAQTGGTERHSELARLARHVVVLPGMGMPAGRRDPLRFSRGGGR